MRQHSEPVKRSSHNDKATPLADPREEIANNVPRYKAYNSYGSITALTTLITITAFTTIIIIATIIIVAAINVVIRKTTRMKFLSL